MTACAAGESHSLFVKNDGSLWAMGRKSQGAVGRRNQFGSYYSVKVVDENVTAVTADRLLFVSQNGRFGLGNGIK